MVKENPQAHDYWQGYRDAKINAYMVALDRILDGMRDIEIIQDSPYSKGFAAGMAALEREMMQLIRKGQKDVSD